MAIRVRGSAAPRQARVRHGAGSNAAACLALAKSTHTECKNKSDQTVSAVVVLADETRGVTYPAIEGAPPQVSRAASAGRSAGGARKHPKFADDNGVAFTVPDSGN